MTKDFSKILEGKRQVIKGRSLTIKGRSLKIGSAGFLGKTFGAAITGIMLCGFCGSIFMGWLIKADLDDLANKEMVKKELVQIRQSLVAEKEELLAKGNFESAAERIGLYQVTAAQVKHF